MIRSQWRYAPILFCVLNFGCDAIQPPDKTQKVRALPSSHYRLIDAFESLIESVKAGQTDVALKTMEPFLMTRKDFDTLFPPALSAQLWPKYRDVIAVDLRKEVAQVLVSRIKAGFDTIDCVRVSSVNPKHTTRGDLDMISAMNKPPKMYTVRLRPNDSEIGLRLNGFVFVNGRWRTLLKTYNYLPKTDAAKTN